MERHPGIYQQAGRFTEMIQREGKDAEQRMSLGDDLRVARGAVQELILACEGQRPKPGEPMGIVDTDEIETQPLRQYVDGTLVPIDDVKRLALVAQLLNTVTRLAVAEEKFQSRDHITGDQMKVWWSQIWSRLQEMFRMVENGELATAVELEHWTIQEFKKIGNPATVRLNRRTRN